MQGQERKNTADAMPAIIRFFDMQKAPDQNPGLGKKPFPFCLLNKIAARWLAKVTHSDFSFIKAVVNKS